MPADTAAKRPRSATIPANDQTPLTAAERAALRPLRTSLKIHFDHAPGHILRREAFLNLVGSLPTAELLLRPGGGFVEFSSPAMTGEPTHWVRPARADVVAAEDAARQAAAGELGVPWEACLELCGAVLRPGARDGHTAHLRVAARSYLLAAAAARLSLPESTLEAAVDARAIPAFHDPEGRLRLPAAAVEAAADDEDQREVVAAFQPVRVRDLALVSGLALGAVRGRLAKAGLSRAAPLWGQVRGQWGLPPTLRAFQTLAVTRREAWLAGIRETRRVPAVARNALEAAHNAALAGHRRQNAELRRRLLEVFPAWTAGGRPGQRLTLHVGPTNSGKTFDALRHLEAAGSGSYLAPLRLLAYEVYQTLNQRGVRCNLLTGEERIDVPGARITASTIEMFAPQFSGACTVIDEAHMLGDEQRGWAWTQALMETRSPDIRVIGAPESELLVTRLAEAAGLEMRIEQHRRLAPLEVHDRPWALATLPPQTILVAFSREVVLGLKHELEQRFRRPVSVVYGALPPEVRHRQAARFAAGETEICVATDAIGMGLNLPARNVCFFATAKFDGRLRRSLLPGEIRQIAGRAGRYGLMDAGRVGALSREDLELVADACSLPIEPVAQARVAPTPEALALLPGTLAEKLRRWMELNSIPEEWRRLLKPTDLSDAIALADLLTPDDVAALGEEAALRLIRAPATESTQAYWQRCAAAIVRGRPMPRPVHGSRDLRSAAEMEAAETAIRAADVYLWLSQRPEFASAGPDADLVREARARWALLLDDALRRRVNTARRCRQCGRSLPPDHPYGLCDRCFRRGRPRVGRRP